jgi:hypothetical protein
MDPHILQEVWVVSICHVVHVTAAASCYVSRHWGDQNALSFPNCVEYWLECPKMVLLNLSRADTELLNRILSCNFDFEVRNKIKNKKNVLNKMKENFRS